MIKNLNPSSVFDAAVVIPAYNASGFIVDALDSIMRQTVFPKEVIVINDGSSDSTFEIVENWIKKQDLQFKIYLENQENKGLPATRNVGIRLASSKWIALLDADDVWEPMHLERLMNAAKLRSDAIVAYGAGRLLVGDSINPLNYDDFWDNPSKKYGEKIPNSDCLLISRKIFRRLIKGNFIKPSSLMFLKKINEELMLFNEKLKTAEDREFLVRLIFLGNFIYDPTPITLYRWHEDNISQGKNSKRNMENGLRALKVIQENDALSLNHQNSMACNAEIHNLIKEYLYICATRHAMEYIRGLKFLYSEFGFIRMVASLNPAHIARCFLSRVPVAMK